jgi:hypothetical protein
MRKSEQESRARQRRDQGLLAVCRVCVNAENW